MFNVYKVSKDSFAHATALLRVELAGIEIIFLQGGRVGQDIVGHGSRIVAQRYIVAVYEIDVGILTESGKQVSHLRLLISHLYSVPSHTRHLVFVPLRLEPFHLRVEDADTVYISLLGMAAQ